MPEESTGRSQQRLRHLQQQEGHKSWPFSGWNGAPQQRLQNSDTQKLSVVVLSDTMRGLTHGCGCSCAILLSCCISLSGEGEAEAAVSHFRSLRPLISPQY